MTIVRINGDRIKDWDSFHDEFATQDPAAWASAIVSLLEDGPDARRRSLEAKRRVRARFSAVLAARRHEALYEALLCRARVHWTGTPLYGGALRFAGKKSCARAGASG